MSGLTKMSRRGRGLDPVGRTHLAGLHEVVLGVASGEDSQRLLPSVEASVRPGVDGTAVVDWDTILEDTVMDEVRG